MSTKLSHIIQLLPVLSQQGSQLLFAGAGLPYPRCDSFVARRFSFSKGFASRFYAEPGMNRRLTFN